MEKGEGGNKTENRIKKVKVPPKPKEREREPQRNEARGRRERWREGGEQRKIKRSSMVGAPTPGVVPKQIDPLESAFPRSKKS